MRSRSDLRVGLSIARAEIRDFVRRTVTTRREQAVAVLVGVLVLAGLVTIVRGTYQVGAATRGGSDVPVVAVARNLLAPLLLAGSVFAGLSAVQSLARESVRPLLLTSASTPAIVIGKVGYQLFSWLLLLSLGVLGAFAYALGARAPLFFVVFVAALVPVLVLAIMLGLCLGYGLWLGVELLGLPEHLRRLVTASLSMVAVVVALLVGFSLGRFGGAAGVDALPTGDPATPLGYYADLLFVGSPVAEPLGLQTFLAAAAMFAALPLTFGVLVRLAPRYWYATPAGRERETGGTAARPPSATIGRTGGEGLRAGLLAGSGTLRATLGYVRGAVRRPDQYVYLFYYLFPVVAGLLPLVLDSSAGGPVAAGVGLVLLGSWFAGGVFCLNPLGTEGAMLSQLVLAATPAATFVRARLLAGLLVGVPLAAAGVALVSLTLPVAVPAGAFALWTVLVAATVVTSAALALGIGSVLPKFETTEVFDSVETLAPSVIAAIIHGVLVLALLAGSTAVTGLVALPGSPLGPVERTVVLGVAGLCLASLADGSRRYAVARLEDHGRTTVGVDRLFTVYFAAALAIFALVAGQAVGIAALVVLGADLPTRALLPTLFVLEYAGYALVAAGFLYVTRRGRAYLDVAWPSPREGALVVAGVAGSLALWAAGLVTITGLGLPAADHALFDSAGQDDPTLLLLLVPLVLLVNGPVEELLYRNVIQKYLAERFTAVTAIVVASALFSLVHLPVYLGAGAQSAAVTLGLLFAVSLFWGWLYARTHSLVVVGAVHGLYNALLVLGVSL